eukprot:GHVU01151919.1.p1 GENE.GHVU01151919.1~~GHVU01151919.1.p1  ORF type:complete len:180 (+),score=20.48 GHVU01151919.1:24-542(+)
MASCVHLGLFVIVAFLPLLASGNTCLSPQVRTEVYTSSEKSMSTNSVIVVEFSVKCKNGVTDMNVYAELNGKALPASKAIDSDMYQVSFSEEHAKLPSGTYNVRFFDEDGYGILRKAQRTGEDTVNIKDLFTVTVNHQGASKAFVLQSELCATLLTVLVWYFAYTAKSKLQA